MFLIAVRCVQHFQNALACFDSSDRLERDAVTSLLLDLRTGVSILIVVCILHKFEPVALLLG
jgi:hypothetical protein